MSKVENVIEKMEAQKKYLLEKIEILKRINANESSTYIDDHDNQEKKIYAIGILVSEESRLVLIYESSKFSLNGLYIGKDDKIHLSQCSEAGIMNTRDYLIDEAVKSYNLYCIDSKKIKYLVFPNGKARYF